jgi:hypothetical protein
MAVKNPTTHLNIPMAALVMFIAMARTSPVLFLEKPKLDPCDRECMSYCAAFYPTSGCLQTCRCELTELGQVLYDLPSTVLEQERQKIALVQTPSYDEPTNAN